MWRSIASWWRRWILGDCYVQGKFEAYRMVKQFGLEFAEREYEEHSFGDVFDHGFRDGLHEMKSNNLLEDGQEVQRVGKEKQTC